MSDPTTEPTPDAADTVADLVAEAEKVKAEGGYVLRLDSILTGADGRLKSAQTNLDQAMRYFLTELAEVQAAEGAGEFALDGDDVDDLQAHLLQVQLHLRAARRVTKNLLGSTSTELSDLAGELGKLGVSIEDGVKA